MKPLDKIVLAAAALLCSACARELVVVLADEQGRTGAVTVEGSGLVLDRPLAGAKIYRRGRVRPAAVSQDAVQRTFADALAAQPPAAVSYTLYFYEDSIRLLPQSGPVLETLLADVHRRAAVDVQVTGHTDRLGSVPDNDRLALRRAREIAAVLRRQGLQGVMLRAVGRGEREPLVVTADEAREPRNRRVEVIVR